jgi:TolB-like protein/DNA-binding winged helix-turn-helix (wHTH) protein
MPTREQQLIHFGPFEVDLHAGELFKNGKKLKLQPQPIQVLGVLLEKPSEVISREEFRERLWAADTFVDFEHSLNTAVKKLRQALGDEANTPVYIETLPRRGYRFIGALEPDTVLTDSLGRPSEQVRVARKPMWRNNKLVAITLPVLAMTVLVALSFDRLRELFASRSARPRIESLAVLPLADLSGDSQQEYFADSMTDELLTTLGKIPSLRVVSHQSVMRYRGTQKPLPEIARELNVDAIVEGRILRFSNRVRISAQLIQARPEKHLWADSYEDDLGDVLALQNEIAQGIAREVRATLTPADRARLATTRKIAPSAQLAYLRGRYFVNRWPANDFMKCEQFLKQATLIAPSYAEAHAALAVCYAEMSFGHAPNEIFPRVKAAALQAIEIDDTVSEGHAALGLANMSFDWEWAAAEREFRLAIDLNPNDALTYVWYSNLFLFSRHFQEAITQARKAVQLDPASLLTNRNLTFVYIMARRYLDAISQAHVTLELDPANSLPKFDIAWVYALQGESEKAHKAAAELGIADYAFFTLPDKRKDALQRLNRELQSVQSGYRDPFEVAVSFAHLGDKEQALEWLAKAYEQRSTMMMQLGVSPDLDSLRSDPRFQDLLRLMNFPS